MELMLLELPEVANTENADSLRVANTLEKSVSGCMQGSAEAVRDSVQALASEVVGVKVVSVGVGPVSASDVQQASALGADVLAFNVKGASADVDAAAKRLGVNVMQHRIIYRLLEEACSSR